MVAFSWASLAVFTEFYFTLKFSHIVSLLGLRRDKLFWQRVWENTSAPPQYRLLLLRVLCWLSKLFDCQNTEFFKLIEREGASRSMSLQAGRWVLAWGKLPSPLQWPFGAVTGLFRQMTSEERLHGDSVRSLNFLARLKGAATAVTLIIFFVLDRSWDQAEITLYCTQCDSSFSTWNHFLPDDRDGGLAWNTSGFRQFYTQLDLVQICAAARGATSAPSWTGTRQTNLVKNSPVFSLE